MTTCFDLPPFPGRCEKEASPLHSAAALQSAFGAEFPKAGETWGIQIGRNGPGYTLFSVVYSGPYGVRTSEQFGHLRFR